MKKLRDYTTAELRAEIRRREKVKKHFITYASKPRVVWGAGRTEATAEKDANKWVSRWYAHITVEPPQLKTVECTKELYDYVKNNGGGEVPFFVRKGFAKLNA